MKKEIIAFKGFDENFKCRDFQYEVNKTYIYCWEVKACSSGFHSCVNPFDVLSYYDITSRFASVIIGGELDYQEDDSKVSSSEITIKEELKLHDFVKVCFDYLYDVYKKENNAASGNSSKLATSGNSSKLATSGHSSQLATSGNYSKLAASGDYSQLAASGDYSKLAASGNSSQLAASGNCSQLAASGDYSVAVALGLDSKIKCGINGAMSLARWVNTENKYRISVAYVGENGIKPDTWYKLDNDGNFVEIKNE